MAPGAGPSNKILKVQSHSAPNGNLLHFHSKSSVTSFSSQNTFIPLNKSRVQFEFEQPGRWASRPFKDKVARLWILHDQVLDNTTQKWLMSNKKKKKWSNGLKCCKNKSKHHKFEDSSCVISRHSGAAHQQDHTAGKIKRALQICWPVKKSMHVKPAKTDYSATWRRLHTPQHWNIIF